MTASKSVAKSAISRRRVIAGAGAALAAPSILRIPSAYAAYPDKPVRIIVANTAGGPSDIMARTIAPLLQEAMGSSFVVENVGGGGGNIGMGRVARADPDGYTLLLSTSGYAVNPGLFETLPYDPIKDFAPIAELGVSPNVIAVLPSLGVKTIKELVTLAKANQDKFNIATPPVGTTPQLAAELFKLSEGLNKVAVVVHAGGGQALQALLSNAVQINIGVLAPAHAQIQAGTVIGLAITGDKRWHDLPNIPTMVELGYKDFVSETYTALLAPAKTPPEIVAALEKATLTALNKPEIRARLLASGFTVTAKTGKGHMERIEKEVPMFKKIIAEAGIKLPSAK
jgi:tripartite-type tricarboxylate transporter receptor subunit TctC